MAKLKNGIWWASGRKQRTKTSIKRISTISEVANIKRKLRDLKREADQLKKEKKQAIQNEILKKIQYTTVVMNNIAIEHSINNHVRWQRYSTWKDLFKSPSWWNASITEAQTSISNIKKAFSKEFKQGNRLAKKYLKMEFWSQNSDAHTEIYQWKQYKVAFQKTTGERLKIISIYPTWK